MKTLYIECNMGAAGDMLMGALLELHDNPKDFIERFNRLNIPKVHLERQSAMKCGIMGTHMAVKIDGMEEESCDVHEHGENGHHHEHAHEHTGHEHHHTSLREIQQLLDELDIPQQVREDAKAVYNLIAEAEGHAHGKPVCEIHFHEVGTMDAVADIVGVCMLINELAPDTVVASPVHVGSGHVHCAHGILPVPAPATAYILKDVPIYGGRIQGELCTPTGAALLKHFCREFGDMPVMRVEKTGYGMGKKDFEMANCVRAMIGESEKAMSPIIELCCNLDDMTPEALGFATELFMKEGALDVYITTVQMKKNRPGVILTCMCRKEDKEKFLYLLFKHTTTLGVREYECNRYGLERNITTIDTQYGPVHVKKSTGYGVAREKTEYEDIARIARETGMSLAEVSGIINNRQR